MPSDPGFRRRSGRHDWSRPAGDGPLVSRVEVGDVEGHVPVSLPQGRLTGGGRLAACAGAGPVQQLEAVAQRRGSARPGSWTRAPRCTARSWVTASATWRSTRSTSTSWRPSGHERWSQDPQGRTGKSFRPKGSQAMLIRLLSLLVLMTYLTRLTRTFFTESRSRASHNSMGTSGARLSAILMSFGSDRGGRSKQLTAMAKGVPLRSK